MRFYGSLFSFYYFSVAVVTEAVVVGFNYPKHELWGYLWKGGKKMQENRGCGCGFGFGDDCICIIIVLILICCCCGGGRGGCC